MHRKGTLEALGGTVQQGPGTLCGGPHPLLQLVFFGPRRLSLDRGGGRADYRPSVAGHFLNWEVRIECSGPIVAGDDREIVAVQKTGHGTQKARHSLLDTRCRVAEMSCLGYIWNEAESSNAKLPF